MCDTHKTFRLTKAEEDRFWQKVDKSSGCWIWKGKRQFCINCIGARSVLLVSQVLSGVDPSKKVYTSCGLRGCLNPDHLVYIKEGHHFCSKCRLEKVVDEFATPTKCRKCCSRDPEKYKQEKIKVDPSIASKKYYETHKIARQKASRDYGAKHREERREWCRRHYHRFYIERQYGLTISQYNDLLVTQEYVCAICKRKPLKHRLGVDHNHTTGSVRGLLCHSCNLSLGLANDDEKILVYSIEYLCRDTYNNEDHLGKYSGAYRSKHIKGVCEICRCVRDLRVDHCHKSNKIRGLLCHKCNTLLGGFHDCVEDLRRAIVYLQGVK
jgi:hypothetical protein